MGHFAKIDLNNIVEMVLVSRNEDDNKELEISIETGDKYRRTSYNTHGGIHYQLDNNTPSLDQSKAFRKNYAGIGYTYDEQRDAFIPPKPYLSWILNEFSCLWEAPIPYPKDGKMYTWNEELLTWKQWS